MTQTLDISAGVSEEQYRAVLERLLAQFEDWRLERRWCTEMYLTVTPLTRSFWWNRDVRGFYGDYDGHMEIIPVYHTDESRAEDLRNIRGRILRYANNRTDVFSLDKANEFLTHSGLSPYVPEGVSPAKKRFYVDLSGTVETDLTEEQLRAKFEKWMKRNGYTGTRYIQETGPQHRDITVIPESELADFVTGTGDPGAGR